MRGSAVNRGAISREQLAFYRCALGLLGLLHAIRFWVQRYPDALSGDYFVLPLAPSLALHPLAHKLLYAALLIATTCVTFGVFAKTAAAYCAGAFLYCELFDYQAFHHDIFLAANLFLLLAFALSADRHINMMGVFSTRVLIAMVYLFAAANKISPEYLSGEVCEFVLGHTPLGRTIAAIVPNAGRAVAISSMVVEFAIPIMLLVPSRNARAAGMIVGSLFHLGILLTANVGHLFNLYIPAAYVLYWIWGEADLPRWSMAPLVSLLPFSFAAYVVYQFAIHIPLLTIKVGVILACSIVGCAAWRLFRSGGSIAPRAAEP
jgi:hypothetical protein